MPGPKTRMCKGCFQTILDSDPSDCTRFANKSRKGLIKLFNIMLNHYGYRPIKAIKIREIRIRDHKGNIIEYKKLYEQFHAMLKATEHHIYLKRKSLHRYKRIRAKLKALKRQIRKGWINSVSLPT